MSPPKTPDGQTPRPRGLARLRAFLRADRGATALEFALVAPPFFFMIMAIFELAMVYVVSVTLDSATQQAARLIRTGQAQASSYTEETFEAAVCANLGWLSGMCQASTNAQADANNLYVDAEVKTAFGAGNPSSPMAGGVWNPAALKFNMGGPGDIIILHTYFKWPLITPVLYGGLQQIPGTGQTVVTATTTFRNEPFSS